MRQTAMNAVFALAQRDPRVVFIGSDLGAGTLDAMRAAMPERFFMEGVSEANVIGMAAGLAMNGYIPYVNTIATFLTRRCFEQLAIDLCLHDLPVRLIGSGGGAVYAPLGPTHMATDDLAIMRALPKMTVVAPVDAPEMQRVMDASLGLPGPLYIRVAKGNDPVVSHADLGFEIGRAIVMRDDTADGPSPADGGERDDARDGERDGVLMIGTGVMTNRALAAAELLADRGGIRSTVLHAHTVKPLDAAAIRERAARARLVVSVEEHSEIGGLGGALAELLSAEDAPAPLLRLALPDRFIRDYGSQDHVLERAGLQPAQIAARIENRLARLTPPAAGRRRSALVAAW